MNKQEFVALIREVVSESAIESMIENLEDPPGRRPQQALVQRSEWYNSLSKNDQAMVKSTIAESVHEAVFGMLCVFDGVRSISDDGSTNRLSLSHGTGETITNLNSDEGEALHNLYNDI